jgi:hypothetical protein
MTQPSAATTSPLSAGGHDASNLGDILERVLDRGIVIAGDIRVNLLDIELLTIKLRLVIASVDTAREMGIDWWEHDPWLTSRPARPLGTVRRDTRELEAEQSATGAADAARRPPAGVEVHDDLDR